MAETSEKLPLSAQEDRVQFLFKRLFHYDPDIDIPKLLFGDLAEMLQEDGQPSGNPTAKKSGPSKAMVHQVAMFALQPGLDRAPLQWVNLSDLAAAYTLMLALGTENEAEDKEWIKTHALVCHALERYPEALLSFDKLTDRDLGGFAVLADTDRQILNTPIFMNNFGTRFSMAWNAFLRPAMELLNAWKRVPCPKTIFGGPRNSPRFSWTIWRLTPFCISPIRPQRQLFASALPTWI